MSHNLSIAYPRNLLIVLRITLEEIDGDESTRVEAAIDTLPDTKMKTFLHLYFRDSATFDDIERIMGLSEFDVRDLLNKSLKELKDPKRIHLIKYGGPYINV